jgi:thiol-disulfide isomerase/thioredoxin
MQYIEDAEKGTIGSLGAAPDFTLKTFNDETFKLSEKQGKVVLLDFMADYCQPCHNEMPELQEVKQELGSNIVMLSIDVAYPQETEDGIRASFSQYILE